MSFFARPDVPSHVKETGELKGERSAIFDLARGRLTLVSTTFLILFIIVVARLVDLTIVQGVVLKLGASSSLELSHDSTILASDRGEILDRNGVLLATTLRSQSLFADPVIVDNPEYVANELHQLFPDLDRMELIEKLSSKKRFVWIKRDLTPDQQKQVLMIGEPGLNFKEESRRIYPQGHFAAHLLGYTNIDGKGLSGLEGAYNTVLGERGTEIQTTIDVRLQHVLQKEIARTVDEFKAKAASALIMDVKTGEVLAGLSWPDFDPNHISDASDKEKFNTLTLGVYELGSIFKIFSTATLLEEGSSLSRTFDARAALEHGRYKIHDYHAEKRILTVPEVFIHSSNIGSALMGEAIGAEKLQAYYEDLGLFSAMDFDVLELGTPLRPRPWRDINTLTATYGHGIAVSPLHLAAAVATVMGDGTYVAPHLLKDHGRDNMKRRVFSEDTVYKMRRLMRLNSVAGTGVKADVPGYHIGGKTGTAEKPGVKGYDRSKKIASFVSVFPMSDPQYLVLVVVDEPVGHKGTYNYATGGWVAAPAAERIVRGMVQVLALPEYETNDKEFIGPLKEYLTDKKEREKLANADF